MAPVGPPLADVKILVVVVAVAFSLAKVLLPLSVVLVVAPLLLVRAVEDTVAVSNVPPLGNNLPFVDVAIAVSVPSHDSVPLWLPHLLTILALAQPICSEVRGPPLAVHEGALCLAVLASDVLVIGVPASASVGTPPNQGLSAEISGKRLARHLRLSASAKVPHLLIRQIIIIIKNVYPFNKSTIIISL